MVIPTYSADQNNMKGVVALGVPKIGNTTAVRDETNFWRVTDIIDIAAPQEE